jgi:5-methylcytosine-specific restriction endonuclease McrA
MSYGGRRVAQLRAKVIERWGRRCHLCKEDIVGQVSVDHLIPRSRGGTDDIENLRPAHLECNKRRGARRAHRLPPPRSAATLPAPSRKW